MGGLPQRFSGHIKGHLYIVMEVKLPLSQTLSSKQIEMFEKILPHQVIDENDDEENEQMKNQKQIQIRIRIRMRIQIINKRKKRIRIIIISGIRITNEIIKRIKIKRIRIRIRECLEDCMVRLVEIQRAIKRIKG